MDSCDKEMHRKAGESTPLKPSQKKMDGKRSKKEPVEQDVFDSGFTYNEVTKPLVHLWLGLQVVGWLFQLQLWNEVGSHLSSYQEAVAANCARSMHGVCTGPMWNVTAYQEVTLKPGQWSGASQTYSFSTRSNPPTFLIAIDPVAKSAGPGQEVVPALQALDDEASGADLKDVHWTMEVKRTNPPQTGAAFHKYGIGQKSLTIEDLSLESQQSLSARGQVDWSATLTARPAKYAARFVSFVEDALTPHLKEIHASQQCTFGKAWKAFNDQHQGHGLHLMNTCRYYLGVFLLVGAGAIYLVHSELNKDERFAFAGKYRFHAVVLLKFVLQDAPQQVCIVLYLLGWYEAEGLRCQMCLFDMVHCGVQDPFHLTNAIAFGCCLLSSVSNQLLVRPIVKKKYTEDDVCMHWVVRVGGTCMATLPFTTGLAWASSSILEYPVLFHILCAVPMGIGFMMLFVSICIPIFVCCEEFDC